MNSTLVLAGKEFRDGIRNKWIAGATLLLAALAFALTFLGSTPTGLLDVKPLAVTVVSISSLTIFLVPLIALLLGYDAIVGEQERGCLLLMLTYPVSRVEILLGKISRPYRHPRLCNRHRLRRGRRRRGDDRQYRCRELAGLYRFAAQFRSARSGVSGHRLSNQRRRQRAQHGGGHGHRRVAAVRHRL